MDYSWDDHAWRVFHQLRSGAVVSRQVQYGITDTSNSIKTQWQGKLLRQPWLFMIGEIKKNGNEFVYHEWMYDTKRGNALAMQAMAQCQARTPSQSLPTPTARLDAPTQPYAQAPAIPPPSSQPPPVQTPPYSYQAPAPTQQPPAPQVAAQTVDRAAADQVELAKANPDWSKIGTKLSDQCAGEIMSKRVSRNCGGRSGVVRRSEAKAE